MNERILTKDELTVILYWATVANIHGMAGDNAELANKLRRMRDEPAPGPGDSDSNDPEMERYKQRLAQFEAECKRPRPDIAEAVEKEIRKRFSSDSNGGGA